MKEGKRKKKERRDNEMMAKRRTEWKLCEDQTSRNRNTMRNLQIDVDGWKPQLRNDPFHLIAYPSCRLRHRGTRFDWLSTANTFIKRL